MSVHSSARIHPSAVVEAGARLGADCVVGPFSVVGPEVVLGEGCLLHSHAVVVGLTEIGPRTEVFPFASLGHKPQDLKFRGERSRLTIGADCQIREGVTMNPGTEGGGGLTTVGEGCLFMAGAHVAHDCRIGNRVIFANNATCAGHVTVGDFAFLGGLSAVHQFVRIGTQAMLGGMSGLERDLVPFGMAVGDRARLSGLNVVGMKRRGFNHSQVLELRAGYRRIFEEPEGGGLEERAKAALEAAPENPALREMAEFILEGGDRRFCIPAT